MNDDVDLPCPAVLLGATMALMTAYAGAGTRPGTPAPADHRRLMARKIVSHLFFLQAHPHLAPGLRTVVASLHARWACVCGGAPGPVAADPAARDDGAGGPGAPTTLH